MAIYESLSSASPDYDAFIPITKYKGINEDGKKVQEIRRMHGISEERVSFNNTPFFYVTIPQKIISSADAANIFDFWCDNSKANGSARSFKWTHPVDSVIYVCKFKGKMKRTYKPSSDVGISDILLKVIGIHGTVTDNVDPICTITYPTSSPSYNAGSTATIVLSGNASDNVAVTSVTWNNARGGSGTAASTTDWTIPSVALYSGSNVITVTAHDAAGNTGIATLTVTYTPADTTDPECAITSPTSDPTYDNGSVATFSFSGTASDNVAVTSVTWINSLGGSGSALGTASWSVSNITLVNGSNEITVTAHDAAGNTGTDTITVAYDSSTLATFSASFDDNDSATWDDNGSATFDDN